MSQNINKLEKTNDHHNVFSDEELAAMKDRAQELKTSRLGKGKVDGEADVFAKIAEMSDSDRVIAERLHALVKANAPELTSKTWYGFPAYARNDKVVLFFQPASKFKTRYATLGFSEPAKLDDGSMWPVAFAITALTEVEEAKIIALLRKAIG